MIGFATQNDLVGAIDRARRVDLASWMLDRRNPIFDALEDAGDRGCDVHVTLDGAPWNPSAEKRVQLQRANQAIVADLAQHHVNANLTADHSAPFHLKAAVVDGLTYLAQRNFAKAETLLTSPDPADAGAIESAVARQPHDAPGLALRKDRALALEAALIRDAAPGTRIECETESFGVSCISDALLERARRGETNMRLILNRGALTSRFERDSARTLDALRAAGVEVQRSHANEKFCVAGDAAWAGSANATEGEPNTVDWGLRSRDPALVTSLQARFERNWKICGAVDSLFIGVRHRSKSA
jgi:hypothetical protein